MHRLLKRQFKRAYGEPFDIAQLSEQEKLLCKLVSASYDNQDKDRKHFDHILGLNSSELNETNRDIKKILSSLAEAQRLSHTGSWYFDLQNKILEYSDELYCILELPVEKSPHSREYYISQVHPQDKALSDNNLQETLKNHCFDSTYRLKLKSGQIKYIHEQRKVILNNNGVATAIQGVIQDVTTEKTSENELQLYANVFHNSGESIMITDKNNDIIAVNQAFTRVTGYSIDELRGKNPRVLSADDTPIETYQQMWAEIKTKGFWNGELIDRKKNGETYPKWISIASCYNEAGEVTNFVANFTDITQRKESEERFHFLAHHDALTGLLNRFSLEERLNQAMLSTTRDKTQIAVLFIDMDRFKTINDTFGHQVGDELLIEVAKRLNYSVRKSDIVARVGGDEFIVCLTGIRDGLDATPLTHLILHMLGQPYIMNNHEVHSSPSIGISIYPEDTDNIDQLLKNADTAMYHAKELGRNNFQFFTENLNSAANRHLKLENDLRKALDNGEFELYYQPQICSITNRVCGVEALIRWNHPKQGLVPPDQFICMAEKTKLIIPMGDWVIKQACQQLSKWRKTYPDQFKVAVNISAQQLQSTGFVETVRLLVDEYHIKEGELELEVTESAAMKNPDEAIKHLHEIRKMGVELAIDDFGTGYSSLSYLKLLPIHTLKLDRIFVSDLETNKDDAEICAATLALAHNLGLTVVAEGVETTAQQDFLASRECEVLQGYYFSKPLPVGKLNSFLSQNLE